MATVRRIPFLAAALVVAALQTAPAAAQRAGAAKVPSPGPDPGWVAA